jgi:hypothetical protein
LRSRRASRVLDELHCPYSTAGERYVTSLRKRAVTDLRAGVESPAALLVSMARSRLIDAGLEIPAAAEKSPGHRLYDLLAAEDAGDAHSHYNALLRRIVSFARAAEHAAAR